MEAEFWLGRWNKGQIGFHQQDVNASLRAHWADLGVPSAARVFVPLCGKSRDMLWLRAQGHEVVGVELSRIAARDFFSENGMTPDVRVQGKFERWSAEGVSVLCGDLFDLAPADLEGAEAVYDRASLIALPRAMRERYAAAMRALLPPGARTLLVTLRYPDGQMEGPPFSVDEAEVRRLHADAWDVERLSSVDATASVPHLREKGASDVQEEAFRLRRR